MVPIPGQDNDGGITNPCYIDAIVDWSNPSGEAFVTDKFELSMAITSMGCCTMTQQTHSLFHSTPTLTNLLLLNPRQRYKIVTKV